jgi:hypothetical protein
MSDWKNSRSSKIPVIQKKTKQIKKNEQPTMGVVLPTVPHNARSKFHLGGKKKYYHGETMIPHVTRII